jgi:starvation-inducible DNA-binding protein
MSQELINSMKRVLADTFTMYLKAHSYHWNVEGPNFSEYHAFFSDLYVELHAAVDPIAEQIRALDSYAPGSLKRFQELTFVVEDDNVPASDQMFKRLEAMNTTVMSGLNDALKLSEEENNAGLRSYLEMRIDAHAKHGWMLRSFTKGR